MNNMNNLVAIIITLILGCDVILCSTDHWPLGTYTMPKPESGCPHTVMNTWKEAWRYQDLENDAKQGSRFSSNFHMDAKLMNNDIMRGFCTSLNANVQEPWPEGSYCIYRNSNYCPSNMTQGFLNWYDEQSHNQNKLRNYYLLPDGLYNGPSTSLLYCCHTKGKWYKPIGLPTKKPFYLLPYGSRNCQRVMWAVSSLEYIVYDTEDDDNQDEFNGDHVFTEQVKSLPKVFYCYYEGCQYKLRNQSGSFTSANILNSSYPDFQYCSWSIKVNVSEQISLTFQTLDIPNCELNYLDIYEGDQANKSTLLERFCGGNATSGANVTSRTNNLYIVLKSGNNTAKNMEDLTSKSLRFHAEYEAFYAAAPLITLISPKTMFTSTRKRTPTEVSKNIPHLSPGASSKTMYNTYLLSPVNTSSRTMFISTALTELLMRKNAPQFHRVTSSKTTFASKRKTTSTPTPTTALTEISSNNTHSFSPVTSSRTMFTFTRKNIDPPGHSTDNVNVNGRLKDLNNANNENSDIYLFIALPIFAILILLGVAGIIYYWRRHKRKDAVSVTEVEEQKTTH